jgi:hypothetical protein
MSVKNKYNNKVNTYLPYIILILQLITLYLI